MPTAPSREAWRRHGWLLAPFAVAVVCTAAAAAIGPAAWERLFTLGPPPIDAAATPRSHLWRLMLLASAAALVTAPLLLTRLAGRAGAPVPHRPEDDRSGPLRWAVPALVVAGLLLRAMRLGESLWYDEIAAFRTYGIHGPWAIAGNVLDPSNHVAHTLLTWCSTRLLGADLSLEVSLRAPALLFSLGSIIMIYGLARQALPARGAVLAAGLAAVGPVSVLEGVEARGYSMMIFFAAAITWALLAARRDDQPWRWCLYAVLCALGAWSHLMTVFVPIGHVLWLGATAARERSCRSLPPAGVALALGAVLTVTLYAPALPGMLAFGDDLRTSGAGQPALIGPEGWHALLQAGGAWSWWAALPGLALLAIGLPARPADRRGAIVAATAGLWIMLILVIVLGTWIYARLALFALPGFIVLAARGLDRLWRWHTAAGAAACAVVLAVSVADVVPRWRPPKQPLRDAVRYVQQRHEPGQRVIALGLAHRVLDAYRDAMPVEYSLFHGRDLAEHLAAGPPSWAIVYYPRSVSEATRRHLQAAGLTPVRTFRGWVDWENGNVEVWEAGGRGTEARRHKGTQ